MVIMPVGPLGGSVPQEASTGGRPSVRRVSRPAGSGTSAASPDGDRVVLSEAAQALARGAGDEPIQLHLSPAELREMIAPETATDSSTRPEDRHAR